MSVLSTSDVKGLTTFTMDEVDEQLRVLVNLLNHSVKCNHRRVFSNVDDWLDRRIMLMELDGYVFKPLKGSSR